MKTMGAEGDNKKGLVLVTVLWVVIVLMVIVAAVGRSSRLDTRICIAGTEQLRCKWASRAGAETAVAVLSDDLRASDSLKDLWNDNPEDFNDIELEQCVFTVRVIDEASKLNVNKATRKQLLQLLYMTEEIADAIIDWRDKDDKPGAAGVEGGYYENLRYGYSIRNGPFRTIRELLLVKGVSEELLYGEDTNFNAELDYNERDGDQSPPVDNADDQLDKGWIAYLTCYSLDNNTDAGGNKRTNINEADEDNLRKSLKIRKSYAKWTVDNRPKDKYKSIADLINKNSPKKAKKKTEKDSDKAEPLDLETFYRIADKITITDDERIQGRVNINTAPKVVLAALLDGGDQAEQLADDIITYRETLPSGMQSIAEVMRVTSVKIDTFKKIANYITTRSDVFTIRSFAEADSNRSHGARLQAETVVDRSEVPYRILYRYQGANN